MANRFAGGRSPTVADLDEMSDPVGPENFAHLAKLAERSDTIVVAWGDLPALTEHTERVVRTLLESKKPLYCLGVTASGSPKHPSARGRNAVPVDVKPVVWRVVSPPGAQAI